MLARHTHHIRPLLLALTCTLFAIACSDDDTSGTSSVNNKDTADMAGQGDTTPQDMNSVTTPVDMAQATNTTQTMTDVDMAPALEDMATQMDQGGADTDMAVMEDMTMPPDMNTKMFPPVSTDPLGGARPATIRVPQGFDNSEEIPLVVSLHGYTGNSVVHNNYFRLNQRMVNSRKFILVAPDGTKDSRGNQFWNATDSCCGFESTVDDVGYLSGLINEAKMRFNIDSGRVYFVGHSNGGFMSYRMACEHADKITAIFSFAGATYKDPQACKPSQPVHITQMHGTADTTITYNGGPPLGISLLPVHPGAKETVSYWSQYNKCTMGLTEVPAGDAAKVSATPNTVKVEEAQMCDLNGSVQLWTIQGGTHTPALPAAFGTVLLDQIFAFDRTP